jgi:hypothetical protein
MTSRPAPSRDLAASACIVVALLAFGSVAPSAYRYHPTEDTTAKKLIRTLYKRGLNVEESAAQTAGYYEGLLNEAAGVTRVSGRGWFDRRTWFGDARNAAGPEARDLRRRTRDDFLRYDLPPNVDVADYDEERRLVTNSFGMADQEYTLEKPEGAWRIALVGDSIVRGVGVRMGTSFEALLEERLNRQHAGGDIDRYEVLNFGVQGYQITQLVDVVLDRAPRFSPDVYVVALTERSAFRRWTEHLATLVRNGTDLKYDFLKELVREAGITPDHSEALVNTRLSRYRTRILRWALEEMQARAREDGADLVVLLVPSADDPEVLVEQFRSVRRLLEGLSITTIDLLDTFAYLSDLAPVRVSAEDRHPNERGHLMLFESLYGRILADPDLSRPFLGAGAAR